MKGQAVHYFVCANSAQGFVNEFASNLAGMARVYILKGGPGSGKSTLMKKLAHTSRTRGYAVEYLHCSSDPRSLDGVVVPALRAAVVDGTAPHILEPRAPGAIEDYVNMGLALKHEVLIGATDEILQLQGQIATHYARVYEQLAQAQVAYDRWAGCDAETMRAGRALAGQLAETLWPAALLLKKAKVRHRFFDALVGSGRISYLPELVAPMRQRYRLNGHSAAISACMQQLTTLAEAHGYDVEVYHSSFAPAHVELLILRELGVCLLDDAVAETLPSVDTSEVVLALPQVLPQALPAREYTLARQAAMAALAAAKGCHDHLEALYRPAVDFEVVEQISDVLQAELQNLMVLNKIQ